MRGRQSFGLALDEFQIVVGKSHGAEADGRHHHQPHVAVGHVGPQERGEHDRKDNENAAHRRRSTLGQVPLRPVVANLLAEFNLLQFPDDPGRHHKGDEKRGDRCVDDPETLIAKDVQERKLCMKWIEPVV